MLSNIIYICCLGVSPEKYFLFIAFNVINKRYINIEIQGKFISNFQSGFVIRRKFHFSLKQFTVDHQNLEQS